MPSAEEAAHAAPVAAAASRDPVVDSLRGLAILLVIIAHVQLRVPLESGVVFRNLPRFVWELSCKNGNNAVRMFFVISGFLITETALRRWGPLQEIRAARFYRLRFARIAPTLL